MNEDSRIVLCGQISMYSVDIKCPLGNGIHEILKEKRIYRELFAANSYPDLFKEGRTQLAKWVNEGKLKVSKK